MHACGMFFTINSNIVSSMLILLHNIIMYNYSCTSTAIDSSYFYKNRKYDFQNILKVIIISWRKKSKVKSYKKLFKILDRDNKMRYPTLIKLWKVLKRIILYREVIVIS